MNDVERYCDLMKQGFMKRLPEAKPKKAAKPIISCLACMNWHRDGQHTADAATRKVNRAKARAADKRYRQIRDTP